MIVESTACRREPGLGRPALVFEVSSVIVQLQFQKTGSRPRQYNEFREFLAINRLIVALPIKAFLIKVSLSAQDISISIEIP